jgi:hypothetical protein
VKPTQPHTLDPQMVALITSNLLIHMAACNNHNQVTLTRCVGCRVNEARNQITLLLPGSQSELLLKAITQNGKVAAVFSHPESHRTVQIKGIDAQVRSATEQDKQSLIPFIRDFYAKLNRYNIEENYIFALCACDPDDVVAVSFSPLVTYKQTPGANAGEELPPGAALP